MSEINVDPWRGRSDSEEGAGPWRWHQAMQPWTGNEPGAVVLLGFACDEGVRRNQGRAGAADGPNALRAALANMPLIGNPRLRDAGNIDAAAPGPLQGQSLETLQQAFAAGVCGIIGSGSLPIGLGGGHEMAWASWSGLNQALTRSGEPRRVGIINFDAHFDLRAGTHATSGTPFRQIAEQCAQQRQSFNYLCLGVSRFANTRALFERADSLAVRYRTDEQLSLALLPQLCTEIDQFIAPLDDLYLTFCLDVLPAQVAPGVSAPAARGVELAVLEPLLDRVLASGRVRIADIAELNPRLDIDHRTARVAARIVARIAAAGRAGTRHAIMGNPID